MSRDYYYYGWKILVETVRTQEQLLAFVRSHFGDLCEIEALEPSLQDDVMNVELKTIASMEDDDFGRCPVNYVFYIKYQQSTGRVAAWKMGQDARFWNVTALDEAMAATFRFE